MNAQSTLFTGGSLDVACGPDGRILAVGPGAAAAAGRSARRVALRGEVLPGLHDAHLHLSGLAETELIVDLTTAHSLGEATGRIARALPRLPETGWLVGRGWYSQGWREQPDRRALDQVVGARPAILTQRDGHSAWVSSAALRQAGIDRRTPDPPGGRIDRDAAGHATGLLREHAVDLVRRRVPEPAAEVRDRGLQRALRRLAATGLTSVSCMDQAPILRSLQRLQEAGRLPIRVTYNLPVADLDEAVRVGLRSGFGDDRLRIWGVKAFLDGALGSGTALMSGGAGVRQYETAALREIAATCATAQLNVAWHAIGDLAVHQALDALEPLAGAWSLWRPRIEHAQFVQVADRGRMARLGVVASMQPSHAVTDRALVQREWAQAAPLGYAWKALLDAGVVVAFGSDAPVEPADPLYGIDAATGWRRRVGWLPELALTRSAAVRASTWGAAYAVGLERRLGRLRPGQLCDLTVVDGGRAVATVVGGEVVWQRPERERGPERGPSV
ncbi:MAG: amidohydrolase [Candidatus Dormibacteraceae bacterium]